MKRKSFTIPRLRKSAQSALEDTFRLGSKNHLREVDNTLAEMLQCSNDPAKQTDILRRHRKRFRRDKFVGSERSGKGIRAWKAI